MNERWREVAGYPGYAVSDHGRVRSERKVLKPQRHPNGYRQVFLSRDGKATAMLVHRLVGMAFIDNQKNDPFINHKSGDRTENAVANLEWTTAAGNIAHAMRRGFCDPKRQGRVMAKLTPDSVRECRRLAADGERFSDIGRRFGVSRSAVRQCCERLTWADVGAA